DNRLPGKTVWLLGTGTGLAPFTSIIKDHEAYERYERVVLVHGVRTVAELAYQDYITRELPENEYFGDEVKAKLVYYPTVTREAYKNQGRITDLISSGKLFTDLGLPKFYFESDRLMLCGSPQMIADLRIYMACTGWYEGCY